MKKKNNLYKLYLSNLKMDNSLKSGEKKNSNAVSQV